MISILTSILLGSAALAAPSDPSLVRRDISHFAKRNTSVTGVVEDDTLSGVWLSGPNGTFGSISSGFVVPAVYGRDDITGGIWLGVDTPFDDFLSSGIIYNFTGGVASYSAFYSSHSDDVHLVNNLTLIAGDSIFINITASSNTTGTVSIDNLSSGQNVLKDLTSAKPLSLSFVEWAVEYDVVEDVPTPPLPFEVVIEAHLTGPQGADIDIDLSGGAFTVEGVTTVANNGNNVTVGPASG